MDPWFILLLDGALTTEVEVDKATVSALKKFRLNLAVLPSEALQTLQDIVIMELQAREQRMLNLISEKKVKNA